MIRDLKAWELKFSGSEKEDPDEFLDRLKDFRDSARWSSREIMDALPGILTNPARSWYRYRGRKFGSWRKFVREFTDHFVGEIDDDDLMNELKVQTQAKGEKIESFADKF